MTEIRRAQNFRFLMYILTAKCKKAIRGAQRLDTGIKL